MVKGWEDDNRLVLYKGHLSRPGAANNAKLNMHYLYNFKLNATIVTPDYSNFYYFVLMICHDFFAAIDSCVFARRTAHRYL